MEVWPSMAYGVRLLTGITVKSYTGSNPVTSAGDSCYMPTAIILSYVKRLLAGKVTRTLVEKLLKLLKATGRIIDYSIEVEDGVMTVTVKSRT